MSKSSGVCNINTNSCDACESGHNDDACIDNKVSTGGGLESMNDKNSSITSCGHNNSSNNSPSMSTSER